MRCNVNRLFHIIARSLFMIAGRGTFQDISTGEVNDKTQSGDCIDERRKCVHVIRSWEASHF